MSVAVVPGWTANYSDKLEWFGTVRGRLATRLIVSFLISVVIGLMAIAFSMEAEVRTLVRELMLEELFPGEILEIRVMDPALAYLGSPLFSTAPIAKP